MRARLLCAGVVLLCACSLNHLSPQARFSESAFVLNDAARWGQLSHASRYVAPSYRPTFAQRHREWGKRISIAEVEVLSLQIAPEGDAAVSEVSLTWYDQSGMTLHTSWVTQHWQGKRGNFHLTGEDVRDGSPHVFAEVSSGD
jgi:hypothetical protein